MSDPIAVLVGRLNTGLVLIDRESDPDRRAVLEDHWIDLLRHYERACDRSLEKVPAA